MSEKLIAAMVIVFVVALFGGICTDQVHGDYQDAQTLRACYATCASSANCDSASCGAVCQAAP